MPRKARKFIDKKNSVTFQLVHRSQKDPLIADERAPQRVLVPVSDEQTDNSAKSSVNEQRKKEQQKYGIFFDDEYNYLQHLRDVNKLTEWECIDNPCLQNTKINLPSSVFESSIEEKTGILNKASTSSGLLLDLDPDIVAALDDDFDFDNPDNELEDNFIELADAESCEDTILNENYENSSAEENDDVMSLNSEFTFKNEDTKSRFTEYSMSSSIIKRNEQLTLLDDKFERMFESYDENAIGALDNEEIEGFIRPDSDVLLQCVDEYENQQNEVNNLATLIKDSMAFQNCQNYDFDEDDNYTTLENVVVDVREKVKFDCQSILSTYSNIYNHPKLIIEPKVSKIKVNSKSGIPENILNEQKNNALTVRNLAQYDCKNHSNNVINGSSASEIFTKYNVLRKINETTEQKKERKQAIKNYRKERRMERKFNIKTFKEEKKRQEKILMNEKNNIQGNRIL